jgi:hypothetical protein
MHTPQDILVDETPTSNRADEGCGVVTDVVQS